ncbi:MAG: BGTF surface domain-containing protein [Halobacteriales archaeon]
MNRRTHGVAGVAAVCLLAALAAVSAGGVPFAGDGAPSDSTTPGGDATTQTPRDADATDNPSDDGTTIDYEGDRLTLAALPNETVSGEAALPAGTELTVRLASESSASPFLVQETATVAENGTFAAPVDLVGVANGTRFSVTVRHDGETVATAPGIVVGGDNDGTQTDASDGNWTEVTPNESDEAAETDYNTTLAYEGDRLTLPAAPNATVAGTTDLAPGTTLTVRLTSTGASSPFLLSTTATVTDSGRFEATFNTSAIGSGAAFEVTVRHDGDRVATADGAVAE